MWINSRHQQTWISYSSFASNVLLSLLGGHFFPSIPFSMHPTADPVGYDSEASRDMTDRFFGIHDTAPPERALQIFWVVKSHHAANWLAALVDRYWSAEQLCLFNSQSFSFGRESNPTTLLFGVLADGLLFVDVELDHASLMFLAILKVDVFARDDAYKK